MQIFVSVSIHCGSIFGEKCEKTLLVVVVVGWRMSKPEIGSLDVMTRSNQFVEGQNNIFSGGKPAKLPSCITPNTRNPFGAVAEILIYDRKE